MRNSVPLFLFYPTTNVNIEQNTYRPPSVWSTIEPSAAGVISCMMLFCNILFKVTRPHDTQHSMQQGKNARAVARGTHMWQEKGGTLTISTIMSMGTPSNTSQVANDDQRVRSCARGEKERNQVNCNVYSIKMTCQIAARQTIHLHRDDQT